MKRQNPDRIVTGNSKRGSALLVTLLVVSLLLVIVLSFTVYVRLEFRRVVEHQQLIEARGNARLGANLALAELQRLMGPDQRVSAPAELFDGTVTNLTGMPFPPAGHRRWIGVWNSENFDDSVPADKEFMQWLVSEGTSGGTVLVSEENMPAGEEALTAPLTQWSNRPGSPADKALAWYVEDNGTKAQLQPVFENDTPTQNSNQSLPGKGLIPGAVPLNRFSGLDHLNPDDQDRFARVTSLRDLTLLPTASDPAAPVNKQHRFDYTLRSQGVLSNTRGGGLKKDLTIAFENDTVFDRVFPNRAIDPVDLNDPGYFLVPEEKLVLASDLEQNGYIHMGMVRDYYNLKSHIEIVDGVPVLYQAGLDWFDINQNQSEPPESPLGRGTLGPHEMGPANNDSQAHNDNPLGGPHDQRPYGEIHPIFQTPESRPYMHNPVGTSYSYLQLNAWLEHQPEETDSDGNVTQEAGYRIHTQLLTGLFNPYNINIVIQGQGDSGIKFMNWPQVYLNFPGITDLDSDTDNSGFGGQLLRINSSGSSQRVPAGLSRVFAIEEEFTDPEPGQAYHTKAKFGANIADITNESFLSKLIPSPQDPNSPVSAELLVTYDGRPVMGAGNADPSFSGHDHDRELNQVFYEPFKFDVHNGSGSKRIVKQISPDQTITEPFSFTLRIRTTTENKSNAIRPLVDSNIRARWNNPRWDSPLNMDHLAVFSPDSIPSSQMPDMDISDHPRGHLYQGASRFPDPEASARVILFDIPREDLVSLGQLQHASIGRFSYEPSYIVGNSYANPRIPLDDWRASISDTYSSGLTYSISGSFNLYDTSYIVNQKLWDDYVFTTIPQDDDNFTGISDPSIVDLRLGNELLPNPRFLPYEPKRSEFTEAVLRDEGVDQDSGAFYHNAGHLLVDGAFNINSTSVNAWEAFFTGMLGLPVQQVNEDGELIGFRAPGDGRVRFPRIQAPLGDGMLKSSPDENYWTGFRELTAAEVRELAEEMVEQVKRRGPFLSLSEFVNRMLIDGEEGQAGALQAALDTTVNKDIDSRYELEAGASPGDSTQGAGYPGQLLQGDLLQALGPMMSARSDSFTIRAYGAVGPDSSPAARAWCEVEVQRVPDPVITGAGPADQHEFFRELSNPQSPFGRQFRVLSFRWLSEEEI